MVRKFSHTNLTRAASAHALVSSVMSRKEIHIIHQILQYMKSCTALTSASLSKIARSGELNILLTTLIDHDPMTMGTVLYAATKACATSKEGAAPGHQAKRKPGANVEVTRPTKITKVSSYSSKNAFEPQHDKEDCHEVCGAYSRLTTH